MTPCISAGVFLTRYLRGLHRAIGHSSCVLDVGVSAYDYLLGEAETNQTLTLVDQTSYNKRLCYQNARSAIIAAKCW